MFCPKCGNEVQEGSAFCGKCGAPVGVAQQAASSSAGSQVGGAPAPKKNTAKIGIIAAAAVVAVVLVAGFVTNWFGLAGVQPKEAVDVPAVSQQNSRGSSGDGADATAAEVDTQQGSAAGAKSALEDYTWDELSQISSEIADAGSEDAAIEVAKKYNLCTSDGKLDGTQVKSVTLTDGTQTTVLIVGFAHDDKTSGGKAGITFIFGDCVTMSSMNSSITNVGGWEKSQMRAYLNSDGLGLFPDDLLDVIVPVDKLTNNVGQTDNVSSVTKTSDRIWLFSATELCGKIGWFAPFASYDKACAKADAILNAEGSEYKLFRDSGVNPENANEILVRKTNNDSPCCWWERTPYLLGSDGFFRVGPDGHPRSGGDDPYINGQYADYSHGVVPGFSI